MSGGQAGTPGGCRRRASREAGLGPTLQAYATLSGLAVYFGYGIWHSKENQQELPGLTATRGSLEETVQALDSLNPEDTARLSPNLTSLRRIAPKREIQT